MQDKSLKKWAQEIRRLQEELAQLGPMRPGTLTCQYRQPEQRTGAFYQLSYTYQGRSRTEYVRESEVEQARREVETYARFKELTARWVDLALKSSQRQRKLARILADGK
jgi:hypothetical protein